MRYRKKPVEIEAFRATDPVDEWPKWAQDALATGGIELGFGYLSIQTLEGRMRAAAPSTLPGDWIIQGVKGEIYPCKPDIFEATYDEVN